MIQPISKDNISKTALNHAPELPFRHIKSGKVRELYDLGEYCLILATDRVSAFNVSLPSGIPGKGSLLTQISLYWFEATKGIIPNHLAENHGALLSQYLNDWPELISRSMIVKKMEQVLPVEAIVRGYLMGNGWLNYEKTGSLYGHQLPVGLEKCDRLPMPLFTPTKKDDKDSPLTEDEAQKQLGKELFAQMKENSIALYRFAFKRLKAVNLTLVDTKFEFGLDNAGRFILIDEVLTPDSSRYWACHDPEKAPYDKQFVRDYLLDSGWDQKSSPPRLPSNIIEKTQERYFEVYRKLIGTP